MKKILLIPLLCFMTIGMHAQPSVSVEKMGQQELLEAVSKLGKMVFTADKTLQVYNTQNVLLLETALETGLAIVLTDEGQEAIDNVEASVRIAPNVTRDAVTIQGVESGTARVISLNGEVLVTQAISDNTTINISGLASGVYLLQVNNITLKLIKQ